ncbi:protein O11 [Cercopithecine betaherpesvirus 5]|uniref:Protein O11 n=1 Tax=Simian cytomegalovirus (strain Colburn) TaxID=50292 RepID=G8XTJ6_SCMVC|nr:protein O11 [Cercopithecine betaherpesvirus 5]AEV80488.1 protein O11 [Cercopithecine betaherpesvirus 5]
MDLAVIVATVLAIIILLMIVISICCAKPWRSLNSRYFHPPFLVYSKRSARGADEDLEPCFEDTVLILEAMSPQPVPQ